MIWAYDRNFEAMMRSSSRHIVDSAGKVAVRASDYVHDDMPDGPRFSDNRWDCQSIRRQGFATRYLNFEDIPSGYRPDVKLFLLFQGRPHHSHAVNAGVVLRRNPAPLEAMVAQLARFSLITRWGEANKLASFKQWSQKHANAYIEDLRAGKHYANGQPNGPSSVRAHATLLQQLRVMAPAAPNPLSFNPWFGLTGAEVAGDEPDLEARTPPLPREETWEPLLAASAFVIFECKDTILQAHAALRDSRTSPEMGRGFSGRDAVNVLEAYLEGGGRVPLITAFGRNKKRTRGAPNLAMLRRKLNLSENITKPSHRAYNPEIRRTIQRAVDEGQTEYGGLVECAPDSPFAEIGMDEAEYLPSVLRAACYVMIASLSAMRDSEIQAIRRGSVNRDLDVPEISSITFKHAGVFGRPRTWWIPEVVTQATTALEQLTATNRVFARSGRRGDGGEDGEYRAQRDIRRLIDFANSPPERRPGRGRELHLSPIRLTPGHTINAMSLRRSFCVYAAAYPGMDIGIGIQLGHASLRVTGNYTRDRHHVASAVLDDERAKVVRRAVAELVYSEEAIGGPSGGRLMELRAQVVADPARAALLISRAAENYHLGATNDCAHREETAACGPGGPKLADRFCATGACPNAVVHAKHVAVLDHQIARADALLDTDGLHPGFEKNVRSGRAGMVKLRDEITGPPDERND
ncbi:phage integrase family protein [Microbacterium sp. SZ1]|uniref:phage integrase family protein n=1 Tax=Microbacterium sp. SZ1 TaxID=1849736 RepID=UPI00117CD3AF|nr:phage integrase family protein [Microbacterium sp. SZ1]